MLSDPSELLQDESGALKPAISITSNAKLLSKGELALHTAVNSGGGSGQGMSYWQGAARCGRRAVLAEKKYAGYREAGSTLPILKNHFLVGSLYHAMQEAWRKPEAPFRFDEKETYVNVNVQEAARLFRGYVSQWDRNLWGTPLHVEYQLPSSDACEADIAKVFGANVTGKLDMVTELDGAHLKAARIRIPDLEPGRYVVDFKTAEQPPSSPAAYLLGLQAMWYPALYNWQHPEAPVKGMIFDVIYKRSRRAPRPFTREDFGAAFVPVGPQSVEKCQQILRGMVVQGKIAVDDFRANRGECVSWRGEICQFFNKECDLGVSA